MSNIIFKLHCPSCGKNINDDDSICPHCSINLDAPLEQEELEALAQPYLKKAKKSVESGNNLADALVNCNQAIEYTPDSADAHNLRGLILDTIGKTADAILAYQEALRLNPEFTDAKNNLTDAEIQYKNNQWKNVGETSNQQKVELTKEKAILLGFFTVWPFLYMVLFLFFLTGDGKNIFVNSPLSIIIITLHLITMLDMLALHVYYIYHLYNNNLVAGNQKTLWLIFLLLVTLLPQPIYWYLYIWKPRKSNPSTYN